MRPSRPDLSSIKATDGNGCPRCGGAVFAAEQMLARGTVWHKTCFNCLECHRVLDSVLACDGPDRDIYCKLCYAKKFGPKGYGFGAGAAFLMSDSIPYFLFSQFLIATNKLLNDSLGMGKKMLLRISILKPSRRRKDRAAPVAAELYLRPSRCSPKAK